MKFTLTRNDVRRAFRNSCPVFGKTDYCSSCIISDKIWHSLPELVRQAITVTTGYSGNVTMTKLYGNADSIYLVEHNEQTKGIVTIFDDIQDKRRNPGSKGQTADLVYKQLKENNLLTFEADMDRAKGWLPEVREAYKSVKMYAGELVSVVMERPEEVVKYREHTWQVPSIPNSKLFACDYKPDYSPSEQIYRCLVINPIAGRTRCFIDASYQDKLAFWANLSKNNQAINYNLNYPLTYCDSNTLFVDAVKLLERVS